MTRKDYARIAEILNYEYRKSTTLDAKVALENLVALMSVQFGYDNPRFDSYRFAAAALTRSYINDEN